MRFLANPVIGVLAALVSLAVFSAAHAKDGANARARALADRFAGPSVRTKAAPAKPPARKIAQKTAPASQPEKSQQSQPGPTRVIIDPRRIADEKDMLRRARQEAQQRAQKRAKQHAAQEKPSAPRAKAETKPAGADPSATVTSQAEQHRRQLDRILGKLAGRVRELEAKKRESELPETKSAGREPQPPAGKSEQPKLAKKPAREPVASRPRITPEVPTAPQDAGAPSVRPSPRMAQSPPEPAPQTRVTRNAQTATRPDGANERDTAWGKPFKPGSDADNSALRSAQNRKEENTTEDLYWNGRTFVPASGRTNDPPQSGPARRVANRGFNAPLRAERNRGAARGKRAEAFLFGNRHHGADAKRRPRMVTILLELTPGNRGIRRFQKWADPVLCIGARCYVSDGAERPAIKMRRRRVVGTINTLGRRAGACRRALSCVFRNVDLGGPDAYVQPIDLRWLRHDRRELLKVHADPSCKANSRGGLICAKVFVSETYRIWVVPEDFASQLGPEALSAALDIGLNRARYIE